MNYCHFVTKPTTVAITLAAVLFSPSAWAYLDPGSGSLLLQVLLGGIAGLAVAGKMFWWQILSFFGIKKDHHNDGESDSEPSDHDSSNQSSDP